MDKDISSAVIRRLPRYLRYLEELMNEGFERISSSELSKRMNVTASQIRQDLNNFGGFGTQGYGYNVNHLHDEIAKILGLNTVHPVIIIGAGNLGQAITRYIRSGNMSFDIIGLFDIDRKLSNKSVAGRKIMMYEEMPAFLSKNRVDIAALTIPREDALRVASDVIRNGVKAIWNFTHTDIPVPDDVVVENVHLSDSLMQLSYNLAVRTCSGST